MYVLQREERNHLKRLNDPNREKPAQEKMLLATEIGDYVLGH